MSSFYVRNVLFRLFNPLCPQLALPHHEIVSNTTKGTPTSPGYHPGSTGGEHRTHAIRIIGNGVHGCEREPRTRTAAAAAVDSVDYRYRRIHDHQPCPSRRPKTAAFARLLTWYKIRVSYDLRLEAVVLLQKLFF